MKEVKIKATPIQIEEAVTCFTGKNAFVGKVVGADRISDNWTSLKAYWVELPNKEAEVHVIERTSYHAYDNVSARKLFTRNNSSLEPNLFTAGKKYALIASRQVKRLDEFEQMMAGIRNEIFGTKGVKTAKKAQASGCNHGYGGAVVR